MESFGNPRKFGRTAGRVGKKLPVLTVHAGRSAPGQRAAASHTAAIAAPLITRQALFEQAGVIATASNSLTWSRCCPASPRPRAAGW
jgi:acyl-CoA synthetase (NDP forming)